MRDPFWYIKNGLLGIFYSILMLGAMMILIWGIIKIMKRFNESGDKR